MNFKEDHRAKTTNLVKKWWIRCGACATFIGMIIQLIARGHL